MHTSTGIKICCCQLGHNDFIAAVLQALGVKHQTLLQAFPAVQDVQSALLLLLRANHKLRVAAMPLQHSGGPGAIVATTSPETQPHTLPCSQPRTGQLGGHSADDCTVSGRRPRSPCLGAARRAAELDGIVRGSLVGRSSARPPLPPPEGPEPGGSMKQPLWKRTADIPPFFKRGMGKRNSPSLVKSEKKPNHSNMPRHR